MLIIVCGLSGTGKTTVAKLIAEKLSAAHLRTDVIRKELSERPSYNDEEKEKVYREMFARSEELLKIGSVVLDATFLKRRHRQIAKDLAGKIGAPFYMVEAVCPEKIIRERLTKRVGDASEARFSEYLAQKKELEPIMEEHFTIDTAGNIPEQIKNYPFIG